MLCARRENYNLRNWVTLNGWRNKKTYEWKEEETMKQRDNALLQRRYY